MGGEREITVTRQPPRQRRLDYIIRIRPQSGQIHVGPLEIPHLFSTKQRSQI